VNADELWNKAEQAAASARLLLDAGDPAGAPPMLKPWLNRRYSSSRH